MNTSIDRKAASENDPFLRQLQRDAVVIDAEDRLILAADAERDRKWGLRQIQARLAKLHIF